MRKNKTICPPAPKKTGTGGRFSCGVQKRAAGVPPPAAPSLRQMAAEDHVAPRRQLQHQAQPAGDPVQGEHIAPRRQKAKNRAWLRPQGMGGARAASAGPEAQPVSGLPILHQQPDGAQSIPGGITKNDVGLVLAGQTEGAAAQQPASAYCSSLALTTYAPAVTPPKRYFPSVLVLVADTNVSVVTPRSVVTAYRPTKQPATA